MFSVTLETPLQLCRSISEAGCPRSSDLQRFLEFDDGVLWMTLIIGLQHCCPDMVIFGFRFWRILGSMVFGNKTWTVVLEPILRMRSTRAMFLCLREPISVNHCQPRVHPKLNTIVKLYGLSRLDLFNASLSKPMLLDTR